MTFKDMVDITAKLGEETSKYLCGMFVVQQTYILPFYTRIYYNANGI